ncbi:hypothetical protein BDZ91DRAFT_336311 [Kalaharituber pfeilii]|nr:hypothetical protein BDZ91DRAFT_336311 [Kalaharituber pfeilii]
MFVLLCRIFLALNWIILVIANLVRLHPFEIQRNRESSMKCRKVFEGFHIIGIATASIACLQCLILFLWNLVQMWKIMVQLNDISKKGQIGQETLWKIYLYYLLLVPAAHIDKINCGSRRSTNTESPGEETESSTMRGRLETHLRQRYPSIRSLAQNGSSTYIATESGSPPAEDQEITNSRKARSLKRMKRFYSLIYFFFSCLLIAMTIWGVEKALLWYKPDGVNNLSSAGQLIALLVSVGGCLSVIPKMYETAKFG